MPVLVKIPTQLRAVTDGEAEAEVEGATVGEVLDSLFDQFGDLRDRICDDGDLRRFVNVYVGGEDIRFLSGLETEVSAGGGRRTLGPSRRRCVAGPPVCSFRSSWARRPAPATRLRGKRPGRGSCASPEPSTSRRRGATAASPWRRPGTWGSCAWARRSRPSPGEPAGTRRPRASRTSPSRRARASRAPDARSRATTSTPSSRAPGPASSASTPPGGRAG